MKASILATRSSRESNSPRRRTLRVRIEKNRDLVQPRGHGQGWGARRSGDAREPLLRCFRAEELPMTMWIDNVGSIASSIWARSSCSESSRSVRHWQLRRCRSPRPMPRSARPCRVGRTRTRVAGSGPGGRVGSGVCLTWLGIQVFCLRPGHRPTGARPRHAQVVGDATHLRLRQQPAPIVQPGVQCDVLQNGLEAVNPTARFTARRDSNTLANGRRARRSARPTGPAGPPGRTPPRNGPAGRNRVGPRQRGRRTHRRDTGGRRGTQPEPPARRRTWRNAPPSAARPRDLDVRSES